MWRETISVEGNFKAISCDCTGKWRRSREHWLSALRPRFEHLILEKKRRTRLMTWPCSIPLSDAHANLTIYLPRRPKIWTKRNKMLASSRTVVWHLNISNWNSYTGFYCHINSAHWINLQLFLPEVDKRFLPTRVPNVCNYKSYWKMGQRRG
jgi:hypothetical protein